MFKAILTAVGTIVGFLVSYLFRPSFLGVSPSLAEWYGFEYGEFTATKIISAIVGLAIGLVSGITIDILTKNKGQGN